MKLLATLSTLLCLPLLHAAEGALPDWLPPDTKAVIGVRVRSLMDSDLMKSAMSQAPAMPPEAAGWTRITAALGFDLARDVDEVVITTTGQGQNPPMLIFVKGRFNLDRLAGVGAQSYGGVPLLGGGEGSKGVVALLDATTAIAGDPPLVRAAIDRRGHGGIPEELATRVEALRNSYDIWGLGDRPAGYVAPASTPQGFENVDRFQFGILLNHGLELNAEIHSTSAEDAQKLLATASLLEAMMKAQQPQSSGTKLDVHADQGTLRLVLTVPEEEMKKAMAAGMRSAQAASQPKAEPAVAAPKQEPQSGTPRVLNPSGGTGAISLPSGR
jgi:hypothetical protein